MSEENNRRPNQTSKIQTLKPDLIRHLVLNKVSDISESSSVKHEQKILKYIFKINIT